jgi:signal transduction histidine kinase
MRDERFRLTADRLEDEMRLRRATVPKNPSLTKVRFDDQIRTEMARRWNKIRVVSTTFAFGVASLTWILGWKAAGIIVLCTLTSVAHAFAVRNRSRAALSLVFDETLIFIAAEVSGISPVVPAVVFVMFIVLAQLLCSARPRVMVWLYSSLLYAMTSLYHYPGTERFEGTPWNVAGSIIFALVFFTLLFASVSLAIDLLQQKTKGLEGANRRLEELVASKEDLIAAISHQIRTPLAGVLGFAAELEDQWESFSVGERREMAGDIVALSAEIENITEDLTVAARRDLGTLVVRHESVELLGEIEGFAQQCRHSDGIVVAGERCEVEVDRLRLRQVLRSLVTNAVAHGGDRVWLEVASVPDGGMVRVCDDGDGIPEAYQDQMFAPYERLHRDSTLPASMGLGLTIARGLSEVMGGTLTYRRAGGVSFFELTLPHAHQPLTRPVTVPADSQVA